MSNKKEINKEDLEVINGGLPGGGNTDMPDRYKFVFEYTDNMGRLALSTVYGMGYTEEEARDYAECEADLWCINRGFNFIRIVGLA